VLLGSTACENVLELEGDRLHVRGTVFSTLDQAPVPGADVQVCGPRSGLFGARWCSVSVTTGANGAFEVIDELPLFGECPLQIEVYAEDFVTAEVGIACASGTQDVSIGLVATATLTVELEIEHVQLTIGHEYLLRATLRTDQGDAVDSPITWSSDSESVATVDGLGMVTAQAAGETLVVADAGGTPDTTRVTVVDVPTVRTGPTAYVTTFEGVVAVDVSTGALLGHGFDVGAGGLAVTPDGAEVWTASEDIVVIDVATNTVSGATIPVGAPLRSMAFSPDGAKVYATSDQSGTVTVVETASRTVVSTLAVAGRPFDVALTPDGSLGFVTDHDPPVVRRLDLAADTFLTSTFAMPPRPSTLAITPDGAWVYVALQFAAAVAVIDIVGDSVLADPIAVGSIPEDVELTPDGALAFVASIEANTVSVIDVATHTVTETIPVDGSPEGLAVTPDGQTVWVTSVNQSALRRIDVATRTLMGPPIAVPRFPSRIVIAP
jgi:YVTN family beta-propeller protein